MPPAAAVSLNKIIVLFVEQGWLESGLRARLNFNGGGGVRGERVLGVLDHGMGSRGKEW